MAEVMQLLRPAVDVWDWQGRGACRTVNPEVFFHPEGERGSKRRNRDEEAKQVCGGCPVLMQCREHALAIREPFGVWGGLTEAEREALYAASPGTVGPSRVSAAS